MEFAASHHNTAGMILHSQDNMLGEFVVGGPNAVLGCKQCHGSQIAYTKELEDGQTFSLDLEGISKGVVQGIMAKYDLKSTKGVLEHKKELRDGIKAVVDAEWDEGAGQGRRRRTPGSRSTR